MDEREKKRLAIASAIYADCAVVAEFLNRRDRICVVPENFRAEQLAEVLMWSQQLRTYRWLASLGRLNDSADYQAVASGTRAILESSIDVVLLADEPSRAAELVDWERSAKYHHASCFATYAAKDPTVSRPAMEAFARDAREEVVKIRTVRGWTRTKKDKTKVPMHPSRWTNKDLGSDARQADRSQTLFGFERFYESRYRELCWAVHGSGMTAVREYSAVHLALWGSQGYQECAAMAIQTERLLLEHLGLWCADAEAEFAELNVQARAVRQTVYEKYGVAFD